MKHGQCPGDPASCHGFPYLPDFVQKNGANDRIRTDDLRITNALLYRLSYIGLRLSCNLIHFT